MLITRGFLLSAWLSVQGSAVLLDLAVVDLGPFLDYQSHDDAARAAAAAALAEALRHVGMASLVTHGVNHGVDVAANLAAAQRLFAHPEKRDFATVEPQRGHIAEGGESGSRAHEHKEAFAYGYDLERGRAVNNSLQGPNVWPPGDFSALSTGFAGLSEASRAVVSALSLAREDVAAALAKCCDGDAETISISRLNRYSARPDGGGDVGSSPHSDWGLLTLIAASDVDADDGGLQVWLDGAWVPVRAPRGSLVVNGGDYLSLASDGLFVSPRHRVVSPARLERYSLVFFWYPDYDSKVPATAAAAGLSLLECQLDGETCGERADVSFGQFIEDKWKQVSRASDR